MTRGIARLLTIPFVGLGLLLWAYGFPVAWASILGWGERRSWFLLPMAMVALPLVMAAPALATYWLADRRRRRRAPAQPPGAPPPGRIGDGADVRD